MGDSCEPTISTVSIEFLETELAMRIQNIKNAMHDLRILDYYPELRGPFFNRHNINKEIAYNNARSLEIIRELRRREMP